MITVGMTGAHGVGKTTLCRDLQSRLAAAGKTAVPTPEVPREVILRAGDPHFFRRGKNTLAKQFLLLLRQIVAENQRLDSSGILLCDRTILDHWCYTVALFPEELGDQASVSLLEETVLEYERGYDLLFYVPVEFVALDDGIREADQEFQCQIDGLIHGYLDRGGLDYSTVRGSVFDRAHHCATLIESMATKRDRL